MIGEGHIVLFAFPQTNLPDGKMRPALVLRKCPGPFDDWLVCMISSQLRHELEGVDEVILQNDPDFPQTGLKVDSVIRATRLAVVASGILQGSIGSLPPHRLASIQKRVARWIENGEAPCDGNHLASA